MVVLKAGHALLVDLLAEKLLAQVQQGAGIVVDELGVALEAQHLIIDMVGRERAEIAGGDHRGILRQGSNLVLMADQQRQLLHHRAHPRRLGRQLVAVGTDTQPWLARSLLPPSSNASN